MEDIASAIDADGETILNARAGRAIFAIMAAVLESAESNQCFPPNSKRKCMPVTLFSAR
jgi:hypothetical protein